MNFSALQSRTGVPRHTLRNIVSKSGIGHGARVVGEWRVFDEHDAARVREIYELALRNRVTVRQAARAVLHREAA